MYKLSSKSKSHLEGVHPDLIKVVERTLALSPYDFGITQGVRTIEQQKEYMVSGKSQIMNSKHLPQSDNSLRGSDYGSDLSKVEVWYE